MALIQSTNRNSAILDNLLATLGQIKISGVANQRLSLGEVAAFNVDDFDLGSMTIDQLSGLTLDLLSALQVNELFCTVAFYTDEAKTHLLFSTTSLAMPQCFSIIGRKMFFTPTDSIINNATTVSTTLCQPLYWVTVTFPDGRILNLTYKNSANLMFQNVIVASKVEPQYAPSANVCIVTVCPETEEGLKGNNDYRWIFPSFDLTLFINVLDWSGLSEYDRLKQYQLISNVLRNALLSDRYRGGNSALYDRNLDGTSVKELKPLPSKDRMKATLKVRCAFMSLPTSF